MSGGEECPHQYLTRVYTPDSSVHNGVVEVGWATSNYKDYHIRCSSHPQNIRNATSFFVSAEYNLKK